MEMDVWNALVIYRIKSNLSTLWKAMHTVLAIGNGPMPHLGSKLALLKKAQQMLRVLPQLSPLGSYLPLLRPFQQGNV